MNTPLRDNEKSIHILLAEDDDGDAKAVERAFQKANIASFIRRALDGEEALDMFHGSNGKSKTHPATILLADLSMPRMNGVQLVQALRADARLHQTIVFVLTTSKREEDKAAMYNLNVAGYIVKATVGRDFLNLARLLDVYSQVVDLPAAPY